MDLRSSIPALTATDVRAEGAGAKAAADPIKRAMSESFMVRNKKKQDGGVVSTTLCLQVVVGAGGATEGRSSRRLLAGFAEEHKLKESWWQIFVLFFIGVSKQERAGLERDRGRAK